MSYPNIKVYTIYFKEQKTWKHDIYYTSPELYDYVLNYLQLWDLSCCIVNL